MLLVRRGAVVRSSRLAGINLLLLVLVAVGGADANFASLASEHTLLMNSGVCRLYRVAQTSASTLGTSHLTRH